MHARVTSLSLCVHSCMLHVRMDHCSNGSSWARDRPRCPSNSASGVNCRPFWFSVASKKRATGASSCWCGTLRETPAPSQSQWAYQWGHRGYVPSPTSSTTDHNHEPAKLALLPSKCVFNGSDVADWVLVAPHTENGVVSEISSQIIFSQCVISFCSSCWKLFFDLGCVKSSLNTGHLRCLSGLVCTSESDNGAGLGCSLPTMAQATSDQLGLSVHLLWLMQEMSKKNTPSFLL